MLYLALRTFYLKTCNTMFKSKFVLIAVFLCLAASANAQFIWDVTQSDSESSVNPPTEEFSITPSISCFGNTCTVLTQVLIGYDPFAEYRSIFWRSDDAGRTWKKQDPGLPATNSFNISDPFPLNKVDQIDSLVAIAVGYGGLILATFDGGNTWVKQPCPVTSNLTDIDCINSDEGIIVGTGPSTILTLSESGWNVVPYTPSTNPGVVPFFCHAYGEGKYRVISDVSYLYTTLNGWHTVDTFPFPHRASDSLWLSIQSCRFGEGDTIIVGCTANRDFAAPWPGLVRTFDGGHNWQVTIDSMSELTGFSNLSPIFNDTIISSGIWDSAGIPYTHPGIVLLSGDLGATWHVDTLRFNQNLGFPAFATAITFTAEGSMVGTFLPEDTLTPYSGFFARLNSPSNSSVQTMELHTPGMFIFPNPATNEIQVTSSEGNISIHDPLSRSYEVNQTGNMLDVSALPSGVYFVSDGHTRAKFVKE